MCCVRINGQCLVKKNAAFGKFLSVTQNLVALRLRVPTLCDKVSCTTRPWDPLFVNAISPFEQRCRLVDFVQNIFLKSVERKEY